MNKLDQVIASVTNLYAQPNPVIDWNKWVFEGHIKIVANWVEKISQEHEFNKDAVMAAAYLHDLAYAWTSKNDPELDQKSEAKAREVLQESGYSEEEIRFIVDQIIHGHGMHDGQKPSLIEAQVLATADALAHFTTDFYIVICWNHYLFEDKTLADYKKWVLVKIERDLNNKIMFEEYRDIVRPCYESLITFFKV
jgi:hypothetical protein